MAAERREVTDGSGVPVEPHSVESVVPSVLEDGHVPVDYFVAPADVSDTVVVCTDTADNVNTASVSNPTPLRGKQVTVASPGTSLSSDLHRGPQTTLHRASSSVISPLESTLGVETDSATKEDGKVVEVKVIPIEMLYDGTLWSQFDLTKASDTGDEDIFVSESVTAPLSDGVSDVARQVEVTTRSDNMSLSIRDIHKREKDRQKKRILRADPVFREKEKQKAKERMQSRRLDPMYREQERQRDRERRQLARRRNHSLRERERERDKEYKKQYRYGNRVSTSGVMEGTDQCKVLDLALLPCEVFLDYSAANS